MFFFRGSGPHRTALAVILSLSFVYFYCEYLIYFVVQSQCSWPAVSRATGEDPVRALIVADTHLLGSRHGHWWDKLRREWQMQRAFQTALTLHRPDVVFVLGDLFDEGLWCSKEEFEDYVERFHKLFRVPDHIQMYVVAGNHDIGFHYRITPYQARRFEQSLQSPPVRLVSIRGNHFVLLNSMAMEGDGCFLCARAVRDLKNISNLLRCTSGSSACQGDAALGQYSRPVLLQHFPLYRRSELDCEDTDMPAAERGAALEQRWGCLAREATELLADLLSPRAAFGGHTHHACRRTHRVGARPYAVSFTEHSVASFSHRNRVTPEYVLATFTPEEYEARRCGVVREATLKWSAGLLLLLLLLCGRCARARRR